MPRKRLGKETQQELISRSQFREFITDYGWLVYDEDPDLGEDFLIKIFRDQVPSGISFQVQIKSTKDINTLRRRDGRIRYRFDVDDIEHWDVEWPPVLIVIWDISVQKGWYSAIEEIIKHLDENKPNWHDQQTITVSIPFENEMDQYHLKKIDRNLTQKIGPIILKDKELVVNAEFSFPKDNEGQAKLSEFLRFQNSGDPVQLDGRYIKNWEIPDAWKRVYGEPNPEFMLIRMGSKKSEEKYIAQIEVSSPMMGFERIDYIEMFIVKQGLKEITLSNVGQTIPYEISVLVNTETRSIKINFTINFPNLDAIEAKKAVHIQKILSSGGVITLTFINETAPSKIPFSGVHSFAPPKEFEQFVNNIFRIQLETDQIIFLRKDGLFSFEDYKNASELLSILDSGTYSQNGLIANFGVKKPWVHQILDVREKSDRLEFKTIGDESFLEILGTHFDLGPMIQYIKGYWDMPSPDVIQWLSSAGEEDSLNIRLRDVELYEEFPNWIDKKDSLVG